VRTRRETPARSPRVGLFGLLGSGNLGNDGSMQAVLDYLKAAQPHATVSCLCKGYQTVREYHGLATTPLNWYDSTGVRVRRLPVVLVKVLGKVFDAVRTLVFVAGQDVVIVPGMGILEATLPLRPWQDPYALFLLCLAGRLTRTPVALVSVGASAPSNPVTRALIVGAARLAGYRSFRDELSRDAMRGMGVDTSADEVYPDLAFALPIPPEYLSDDPVIGLGVMAYYGGDEDRARSEQIHHGYVTKMQEFVRWLLDNGRHVRLFTGDRVDELVVAEILADVRAQRPEVSSHVITEPVRTLPDLMTQMSTVDIVVATRYHNVVSALRLAKPTIAVGYSAKNEAIMQDMGQAGFCQQVGTLDVALLQEQLLELERDTERVRATLRARNLANRDRLDHQFAVLTERLFPGERSSPRRASRGHLRVTD